MRTPPASNAADKVTPRGFEICRISKQAAEFSPGSAGTSAEKENTQPPRLTSRTQGESGHAIASASCGNQATVFTQHILLPVLNGQRVRHKPQVCRQPFDCCGDSVPHDGVFQRQTVSALAAGFVLHGDIQSARMKARSRHPSPTKSSKTSCRHQPEFPWDGRFRRFDFSFVLHQISLQQFAELPIRFEVWNRNAVGLCHCKGLHPIAVLCINDMRQRLRRKQWLSLCGLKYFRTGR